MNRLRMLFDLLRQTFQEWNDDKAPRLAAALAYYTAFSIAPLIVIVIAILGFVVNTDSVRSDIINTIATNVGSDAAEFVSGMIDAVNEPRVGIISTVLGIVTLLFGAIGAFSQLQGALDVIWDVENEKRPGGLLSFLRDNLLSFGMVLFVGFLLLVSLVINAAIAGISESASRVVGDTSGVLSLINLVLSFVVITALFAMMFKYLPHVRIAWRDVWVGAAVTALLFTIGRFALGLYLGRSGTTSVYGAAGAFVLILLWIYYSSQILLFGAEFTQVYARRYGAMREREPKGTVPAPGPVPFERSIVLVGDGSPRRAAGIVSSVVFVLGLAAVSMVAGRLGGKR
jgi:membrane protein